MGCSACWQMLLPVVVRVCKVAPQGLARALLAYLNLFTLYHGVLLCTLRQICWESA